MFEKDWSPLNCLYWENIHQKISQNFSTFNCIPELSITCHLRRQTPSRRVGVQLPVSHFGETWNSTSAVRMTPISTVYSVSNHQFSKYTEIKNLHAWVGQTYILHTEVTDLASHLLLIHPVSQPKLWWMSPRRDDESLDVNHLNISTQKLHLSSRPNPAGLFTWYS